MKYLRQYIRQIISEGNLRTHNLAAHVLNNWRGRKAVIYDVVRLKDVIPTLSSIPPSRAAFIVSQEAVRGIIGVGPVPEHGPCRGAWAVNTAAGPGYGREVYAAGHALTPDGRLMPDRGYVSDLAVDGWAQQAKRPREPLDDRFDPKTPPPDDDCRLFYDPSVEFLNYVYEPKGTEREFLATLQRAHQDVMQTLKAHMSIRELEHLISEAGDDFFETHF